MSHYVAIVGGFRELDTTQAAAARQLGKELGEALAKAGFGLVVYFSNEMSLEPYVVSGYVPAIPANTNRGCIRVRYSEGQKAEVAFSEQGARADLFERKIFAGDDWEAPFYRSLVDAKGVDAVLLMAGARSTLIAGQIAVARGLPLLAIDRFAGAAGVLWTELARVQEDYPSASTSSPQQLVQWLSAKCTAQTLQRAAAQSREDAYVKATSLGRLSVCAAGAFALLFGAVVLATVKTPHPGYYLLVTFSGLVAAGALGALVRSIFWSAERTAATVSLLLGGLAGFVVGMAYLIPQWVGAPGVLEAAAGAVSATDKIQFMSSVLVAISAGVGFDTIFTRLRKQADDLSIGAPGSLAVERR